MRFSVSVTLTHYYKVPINSVDVSVPFISLQAFGFPSHPPLIPRWTSTFLTFSLRPVKYRHRRLGHALHTPSPFYRYAEELFTRGLESLRTNPRKLLNRRRLAPLIHHKCCRKRWLTFVGINCIVLAQIFSSYSVGATLGVDPARKHATNINPFSPHLANFLVSSRIPNPHRARGPLNARMEPSDKNTDFQAPIGAKGLKKILPSRGENR